MTAKARDAGLNVGKLTAEMKRLRAAEQGVRPGDIIVEVGQDEVDKPTDVAARVAKSKEEGKKSVLLLIDRQDDLRFVALPLK